MASRVIPSGGGVDRATVAWELQADGFTVGSDRAHAELIRALNIESGLALSGIRDTIGGRRINRDALCVKVFDGLTEVRLLRIVGQHGADSASPSSRSRRRPRRNISTGGDRRNQQGRALSS
jgi:hypothetical protein